MSEIAVIGAAGYLGAYVVDELIKNGHQVTAITQGNGELILGEKQVSFMQTSSIGPESKKFDIVINLAYKIGTSPQEIKANNFALLNTIRALSHPETKIIHTSTLVVFGINLDKPVELKPVKMRGDFYYTASKLSMENILLRHFTNNELHIIRLGNIWGAGSPQWTVNVVKNLLFEKPVCAGKFGFSNITDSYNAASYLDFISSNSFDKKIHFHHLAELGDSNWEFWVSAISKQLNVGPLILPGSVKISRSLNEDIGKMVRFLMPKVKQALQIGLKGRFSGYYIRGMVESLPLSIKKIFSGGVSSPVQSGNYSAVNLLTAMSSKKHFENVTDPRWTAPLNKEQSLERVLDWLPKAGF